MSSTLDLIQASVESKPTQAQAIFGQLIHSKISDIVSQMKESTAAVMFDGDNTAPVVAPSSDPITPAPAVTDPTPAIEPLPTDDTQGDEGDDSECDDSPDSETDYSDDAPDDSEADPSADPVTPAPDEPAPVSSPVKPDGL